MAEGAGAPPPEGTNKAPLVLPKDAQDAIGTAIGQAVESLTAILDLVKGAQVSEDPATPVPPELAEQIERIGMMVAALGDQYEGGSGAPAPEMSGLAPEEMALAKQVAKAIGAENVATLAKVVKAGRVKMSFETAMKLHHGLLAKLYDIVSEIAPMISDIGGDVTDAFGKPKAGDGAAPPADATAKNKPGAATPPANATDDALARLEKGMTDLRASVHKIAKTRPAPPTDPGARDATPPPPPPAPIPYGENISAKVRAEEAKKNGAGTGAA